MSLRPVLPFLGRLLLFLSGGLLLPALCAGFYGELDDIRAFLYAAMITAAVATLFVGFGTRDTDNLFRTEGVLIVAGGWFLASVLGALPYLLSGSIHHPVDALFESASGFTTTGSTILLDIEALGRGMLFWRSFTQWLGGMGIIVLFVALLPELGSGARFLYKLEVPGPSKKTMHPRVHDTASVLWRIYLIFTVVQTGLLMLAGLDLYDALTTTFSTLSTGGFSPYNASISHFASPAVELIVIVFMLAAGTNFSLYYGMRVRDLRPGSRELFVDREFRIYIGLIVGVSAIIVVRLIQSATYPTLARAILDSVFQTVSILTTTGFGTADFDTWPNGTRLLLVCLMFLGGCAGSTAGGMKLMRLVIAIKSALREVKMIFNPNAVIAVFVGRQAVPNGVVASVVAFVLLYMLIWTVGALLLTVGGTDLETSASASIAILGNIGPGLKSAGPTASFAFFAAWQKLVMVLMMFLGRLEVFPIAALFTMTFWRR
ncbi:MAG: TrkH family potassium uptake protein [Acidobacteriota bacterium]|nr:TrkH family potassium uptake protein [Acidobacteriota bacterium]